MALKDYSDLMQTYCGLMDDIRMRGNVIGQCLRSQPFPPKVMNEICYLQFRLICEGIALGCLVAHGDIPETHQKKLVRTYQADKIVQRLEELHPNFYPQPGQQRIEAGKATHLEPVREGYLTKVDLLKLYAECGDVLHLGSLKSRQKGRKPSVSRARVGAWHKKIVRLLNHHQIAFIDPGIELWVIMKSDKDGRAHGHIMKVVGNVDPRTGDVTSLPDPLE